MIQVRGYSMSKLKVNLGLENLKIVLCMLVVVLHTSIYAYELDIFAYLYYLGTIAIPLFFMLNGYFLLGKNFNNIKEAYQYIFKKIVSIIYIVVFWNLLLYIVNLNFDENVFENIIKSLLQKGKLGHFWFFGSLIIIYITYPFLLKISKSKGSGFILIVIGLFSEGINILNFFVDKLPLQSNVVQTFRLWTWLFYFLLGGYIFTRTKGEKIQIKNIYKYMLVVVILLMPLLIKYISNIKFNTVYAEYFYDFALIKIIAIVVFLFFLGYVPKRENSILRISSATGGIYVIHILVIKVLNKILPENTFLGNLSLIVLTFVISFFIVDIVSRFKKIRFIFKI